MSDAAPGIRRRAASGGFVYARADRAVRDAGTLQRIRRLAIPPAWTDVWISTDPRGHVQATGRDARGRKQYRYHPAWRAVRDETKYGHMLAFGRALPGLRRRVERDLGRRGMPREKVLAAVVRLLDRTLLRVGNPEYARRNRSYGLTTLEDRHARIRGGRLELRFRGKAGKSLAIDLGDEHLARIVRRCRDLPGQRLFQYRETGGRLAAIDSADVNGYLREAAGGAFTAKDFRTWAGTVLAAAALRAFRSWATRGQARRNLTRAIEWVAGHLGNTPAICKRCYVHPLVLDAYLDGRLAASLARGGGRTFERSLRWLRREEAALLRFLGASGGRRAASTS